MRESLTILLRITGAGLILLALLHVPISRQLQWREDAARMSDVNAAIFHVHSFFIGLVLAMMGLPCLIDPGVFLEKSRAATWASWSISVFWLIRLYCQWFVYSANLWHGKSLETGMHYGFTCLWISLTAVFGICGALQMEWIE